MNIKVLQYIDNTPKNNITTGQVAVTGDNIPSNSSSAVNSTGADFDQVLDDAKMAEAAVAIDRLIAQSNGGSVDMSLVQLGVNQDIAPTLTGADRHAVARHTYKGFLNNWHSFREVTVHITV